MKYYMRLEIEAEQFLPEEDKIPAGVISDGPRSPRTDKRSSWILKTPDGISYLRSGEYVITGPTGEQYTMNPELFEKTYKLVPIKK